MQPSPETETFRVCTGRSFKGRRKLTPVINLVSKITFILFFFFLTEGLIQLSINIFEEHGNEMKKKYLEGILFIEEEFTYLSVHLLLAASC